jgi:hypothetical protein
MRNIVASKRYGYGDLVCYALVESKEFFKMTKKFNPRVEESMIELNLKVKGNWRQVNLYMDIDDHENA